MEPQLPVIVNGLDLDDSAVVSPESMEVFLPAVYVLSEEVMPLSTCIRSKPNLMKNLEDTIQSILVCAKNMEVLDWLT